MGAKQSNTIIIKEDEIRDEIPVDDSITIVQDQTPIDISGVDIIQPINHVPIVDTMGCGCMTTKSLLDIDQRESRGICHCGNQCTCVPPCECKPVKSRWFSGTIVKETLDIQDRLDRIHAELNKIDESLNETNKRIVVLEKLSEKMTEYVPLTAIPYCRLCQTIVLNGRVCDCGVVVE